MYNYSIIPMFTDHLEDICRDIKEQYENKVADMALFIMTLVPEGNPVIDKVTDMCRQYNLFKTRLSEMGLTCGVLVQASIGHGYPLNEMFPFQNVVSLTDGTIESRCCPYDHNVREHFKWVMETIAKQSPAVIMIDDDMRLMNHFGKGCACPLHMAEFNKRANTSIDREQLWKIISDRNHKENKRFTQIFEDIQNDSLIGLAKEMRMGIDKIDPSIQGCVCTAGVDPHGEMASIFAGRGNPSVLRLNNGSYCALGARNLLTAIQIAASQINMESNKADIYLAETDTCPQNRYSTSAQYLHSHFVGTILEGASGAKHWVTRTNDYEPESGKAYREILAKNAGMYSALSELYPSLEWVGCRIPMPKQRRFAFHLPPFTLSSNYWALCALERLGLPLYFSSKTGGAVFLDDDDIDCFTDEEIAEFFKGSVFISGSCAKKLNERGFTEMTGVNLREWQGKPANKELLFVNNRKCQNQYKLLEIVPSNNTVEELSSVINENRKDGSIERLFPGVTSYKNPAGGTSFVFSGSPNAPYHFSSAFSFLNYSRKLQFIDMLKKTGNLPIYYSEDAEVWLKAANMPDGKLFCAVFNIGMDFLEQIPLVVDRKVKNITIMTPSGKLHEIPFRMENGVCIVETRADILNPVILIFE